MEIVTYVLHLHCYVLYLQCSEMLLNRSTSTVLESIFNDKNKGCGKGPSLAPNAVVTVYWGSGRNGFTFLFIIAFTCCIPHLWFSNWNYSDVQRKEAEIGIFFFSFFPSSWSYEPTAAGSGYWRQQKRSLSHYTSKIIQNHTEFC